MIPRSPRRRRVVLAALAAAILTALAPVAPAEAQEVRRIVFPVEGPSRYSDDFGAPRSGGRTHAGNDIFGNKLQHLLAAADGTITFTRFDQSGNGGNMLVLKDAEGWEYWYIHLNNDSPGTDDGANPRQWITPGGIDRGATVRAGQHIAYLGDSGNAENTAPHLHFEIHRPDGTVINPYPSLQNASRGAVTAQWFMTNAVGGNRPDGRVTSGLTTDRPLVCDWNGDGTDTPGIFRDGRFYLRNSNTSGVADVTFGYGDPGDVPVCGDWNGDGTDTPGIFRRGVFYLRNANTTGVADVSFGYGDPGDRPLTGDWNGDNLDSVGIVRNAVFYLRNANTTGVADLSFGYGNHTDLPLAGDWNGDNFDTVGVARSSVFYLRNANSTGVADLSFGYGNHTDLPLAGDWNGDRADTAGVMR